MVSPVRDGSTVLPVGALAVPSVQPDAHASSGPAKAAPPPATPQPAEQLEPEMMVPEDPEGSAMKTAELFRTALSNRNVGVVFVMEGGTDQPIIRVVNRETGDVIRQIPPEEVLALRERFSDLMGMLKDLKA